MNSSIGSEVLIGPRGAFFKSFHQFAKCARLQTLKASGFFQEWIFWIVETRIQRQVAPGKRPLEKHEFESVEIRRGGFGNVF